MDLEMASVMEEAMWSTSDDGGFPASVVRIGGRRAVREAWYVSQFFLLQFGQDRWGMFARGFAGRSISVTIAT